MMVLIACVTFAVLTGAVLLYAPLSIVTRSLDLPPQVEAVYGTLLKGRADLAGGYVLSWDNAPSLAPWPGLGGALLLEGEDTRLTGDLRAFPTEMGVQKLDGRAGPGLATLIPGAYECAMSARISGVTLLWSGNAAQALGAVTLPAGECRRAARVVSVPTLNLELATRGSDAVAVLTDGDATRLASATVTGEMRAEVRVEPALARFVPALPKGGPITLQYQF